jgi:hypothetical protein
MLARRGTSAVVGAGDGLQQCGSNGRCLHHEELRVAAYDAGDSCGRSGVEVRNRVVGCSKESADIPVVRQDEDEVVIRLVAVGHLIANVILE